MWEIILRGLINGALFSLIAVGLNLQYGITRILNIAHGEFLMMGAFITAFLFYFYNVNPLVSLAISGPLVFVIGVLVYLLVFRRLVRMSLSAAELEFRSLLACFGLMFIIKNVFNAIIAQPGYSRFQIVSVSYLTQTREIMGVKLEDSRIVAAVISIILSVLLYVLLRYTRTGLALRATAEEPTGAQIVGINILNVHALSFGLSVFLSALAGPLLGMIFPNLNPLTGAQYTFIALAIIVIGGMGSFIGSMLGGFIIGLIYYYVSTIDNVLPMVVVYVFLIVMLIIRPKGLFGR